MRELELLYSTGKRQVDDILCGTIGILEACFPGRISAYYLHGSFIDDSGIETSDIDLFLVVRGGLSPAEQTKLQQIAQSCARFSPLMVEILVLDEILLRQQGHFRVKCASRLIWGTDLRAQLPDQNLEQYLRLYAHFPFVYITRMLRDLEGLTSPLTYPQANGLFYGYDQQLLPPRNDPQHNIKKLVTGVCWAATVLIAWQSGKTVPGKRASVDLYREHVHDEWTGFIEEMYTSGNRRWRYLVPAEQEECQRLRALCEQTLAFEKHFLRAYQSYLLQELRKQDEGSLVARQQLQKLFLDEEGKAMSQL
ncbi:MAG TPA: nucleotidyltransferase domain-containing protein [Ktedonobacteraceae bacterium]